MNRRMKIKVIIGIVITSILILYSCSMPYVVYITNTTNTPKVLLLEFKDPKLVFNSFTYDDVRPNLKFKSYRSFEKELSIKADSKNRYRMEIPPNSTVFLEYALNQNSIVFSSIKTKGGEEILDRRYFSDRFKIERKGGGYFCEYSFYDR